MSDVPICSCCEQVMALIHIGRYYDTYYCNNLFCENYKWATNVWTKPRYWLPFSGFTIKNIPITECFTIGAINSKKKEEVINTNTTLPNTTPRER